MSALGELPTPVVSDELKALRAERIGDAQRVRDQ
jgi:hypothetical protein